jgi:serine/threonine protein kinase
MTGLLATPGRDPARIIRIQYNMCGHLEEIIANSPGLELDGDGIDLMESMLRIDPKERISPTEALNHPYLMNSY